METLKLVRLDKRRLGDFERFFSGKEFDGCYCSRFSGDASDWQERCLKRPQENMERMRSRITKGEHAGFLALREMDGATVGWSGAGPKTSFPLLKERPASRLGKWQEDIWSIACLSLAFAYRGMGFSRRIVELVVEEARRAGARSIEAYPVEPDQEAQAYRGGRKFYESLGFAVADAEQDGELRCSRMEKILNA